MQVTADEERHRIPDRHQHRCDVLKEVDASERCRIGGGISREGCQVSELLHPMRTRVAMVISSELLIFPFLDIRPTAVHFSTVHPAELSHSLNYHTHAQHVPRTSDGHYAESEDGSGLGKVCLCLPFDLHSLS